MDTSKPIKLSVVVPVYNTEKYLGRCLDSLCKQICIGDMEIIIVDDCSPGKPEKVLENFDGFPIRIVRHEKNRGLFRARVTGAEAARGQFIAFVDSDDYVSADYYPPMLRAAESRHADIVAGVTVRKDENDQCQQFTLHKICFPEELIGEDVRREFFDQAGACYAWHTIWNKIYRKTLWDKCAPHYETITGHLIMTEDVAFSSLLFMNAEHFVSVKAGAYYYCANAAASTNQSGITLKKFEKHVTDITLVFDFITNYAEAYCAEPHVLEGIRKFRESYAILWDNMRSDRFGDGPFSRKAQNLIDDLGVFDIKKAREFRNDFDRNSSSFCDDMEKIRLRIQDRKIKVVSFDIFDTLLLRPLWRPEDIFLLMQSQFEQICPEYKGCSFQKFRRIAEDQCRREAGAASGSEDVTLTAIYRVFGRIFSVDDARVALLQQLEVRTELRFIFPRRAGRMLLDYARECGKKVVYTSDMYLEVDDVRRMLAKCGYPELPLYLSSELRILKSTGSLFKHLIKASKVEPENILHIGDTWNTDFCAAQKLRIRTAFLPKAKDVFSNTYGSNPTNELSLLATLSGSGMTSFNMIMNSLAHRSMTALAANRLFDDPFVSWNRASNLDANPEVVGYYALGMHLVSVCAWLAREAKKDGFKHISFLGRDGYMPIQIFRIMQKYTGTEYVSVNYVPSSRQALLPVTIDSREGLFRLPVSFMSHTPVSLLHTIACCHDIKEEEIEQVIREAGFSPEAAFRDEAAYLSFLRWFADSRFSQEKLESEKAKVSEFYRANIPENALVFDLGYSGSIAASIDKALGYEVSHAFVHEDYSSTDANIRRTGCRIRVMYDFVPQNRDLIRELCFSDPDNQCLGFTRDAEGTVVPVLKSRERQYAERFVMRKLFESAIAFAKDYVLFFDGYIDAREIKPTVSSAPFEGFLSTTNKADMDVFSAVYSEDTVYGNIEKINITEFWQSFPDTSSMVSKKVLSYYGAGPEEVLKWKQTAELYKHPFRVLKYRFMSRFAFSKSKRDCYKRRLGLPK